jgi:hypothetical protein
MKAKYKIMVDTGESTHELPEQILYDTRAAADSARQSILSVLYTLLPSKLVNDFKVFLHSEKY